MISMTANMRFTFLGIQARDFRLLPGTIVAEHIFTKSHLSVVLGTPFQGLLRTADVNSPTGELRVG
jgi:hypothetical protein